MLRGKRKMLLMVSLGAMAVPLFAASGAQADTGVGPSDAGVCVFTGVTGSLVSSDPDENGVEAIVDDLNENYLNGIPGDPTNLSDTDSGTYTFGTQRIDVGGHDVNPSSCLVYSDGDVDVVRVTVPQVGLYPISIAATGNYVNTICGTGTAPGTATVNFWNNNERNAIPNNSANTEAEGPVTASYDLQFVAGHGVLTINNVSNADETGGSGAGYVNITPTVTGGNCVTQDVSQFAASGAFAVQIPEPASGS
jgi:hypothetical protein